MCLCPHAIHIDASGQTVDDDNYCTRRQIEIIHGNVLDIDTAEATVVFVYLVPAGLAALKEALVSLLRAGARVASYGE